MKPVEVGQLLDGVEHAGQRLQADGLSRAQRWVVGRHLISVGDDPLHQTVERRRPAHHPVTGPMLAMSAGEHFADDFVDRIAVLFSAATPVVAG